MKKSININDSIMTLVSIIQGFAFGYISTEFITNFVSPSFSVNSAVVFTSYLLCYAIILKFFQTYLLAIQDYEGVTIDYFDVMIIFGTGIFEFFLFSSLINESYQSFFIKLSVLSILSIVGYVMALSKVKELYKEEQHREKLTKELKIQRVNIVSSVVILAVSVITSILMQVIADPDTLFIQVIILLTLLLIISIVMYNNWNSYIKTIKE